MQPYLIPILSGLLTLVFVGAAFSKLAGKRKASYRKWGLPFAFMYALALAELAGAVLLWIPHCQLLAVGGLLVIMVGAVLVLLRHHESATHLRVPLVMLVLLLVLGFLQWPTARALFSTFIH